MNEFRRIAVGIDGSESAQAALRWAASEASLHGAVLQVLHAWRQPMIVVPDEYPSDLVEAGRMDEAGVHLIGRELASVGVDPSIKIERESVGRGTARALIDASHRADQVVLGRSGTGGLAHELVGPKVVQVAHHATCPVVVVPAARDVEGRGVVVGVDGSEHARKALRWAAREAVGRETSLTAVLAWGLLDQYHAEGRGDFDPAYGPRDAQVALEEIVAESFEAQGGLDRLEVRTLVVNDLPARALLDLAQEAELLVVGARGLGGFRGLLLGSVSHRCLVHAACPTVVIRPAAS